jgi:hypothetical protein
MKNYTFEKDYFEVVRGAISKDLVEYVTECFNIHESTSLRYRPPTPLNPYPYGDEQCPNSFSWYGSLYSESMLKFLKSKISTVINKDLIETYSYIRVYYNNAILKKHKDRPSCEYSATLCIKKTTNWPIYFETLRNEDAEIDLNPGDMIVYKGDILSHWRNIYSGEYHQQIFLHYVDLHGPYAKSNEYDGRPMLGLGSTEKIREPL